MRICKRKFNAGKDYIGHPLRVMEMGKTGDEKIVGVLHDLVEDTPWTFEMLEAEGFSPECVEVPTVLIQNFSLYL